MNTAAAHPARKAFAATIAGAALALVAAAVSMLTGPVSIPASEVLRILFSWTGIPDNGTSTASHDIVLLLRLPRMLLAALAGGALSIAGAVFQVLLRNALAEPYILGVSGGAAVGALLAISTGLAGVFWGAVPLSAFIGAGLVVFLVYALGRVREERDTNTLLLIGVMVGAFLSAIILALVSTIGDPVRHALYWLLGYLGHATLESIVLVAPPVVIVSLLLVFRAHAFNVLALGPEQAAHLGLDVRRVTALAYLAASLLTASVVSFSGSIGFVGLIVPHMLRRVLGPDHRALLPASFFFGAAFLIVSDVVARSVLAPVELPVGAITAALGAPVFIFLLRRRRGVE